MEFEDAVRDTWRKTYNAFAQCFAACHFEDEYEERKDFANCRRSGENGRHIYNEKGQPQLRHDEMRVTLPKQSSNSSTRYKIGAPTNFRHVGGMGNYNHTNTERPPLPPPPPPPPPPCSEKPADVVLRPKQGIITGPEHNEIVSASVLIVRSMNSQRTANAAAIPRKPLNSKSIEDLAEKAAAYMPLSPGERSSEERADLRANERCQDAARDRKLGNQALTKESLSAKDARQPQHQQEQTRSRSKTMPMRFSKHLTLARHKHGMRDAVRELQTIVEELRSERDSLPRHSKATPSVPLNDDLDATTSLNRDKALPSPRRPLKISTRLPQKHCHDLPRSAPPVEASRFGSKHHSRSISSASASIRSSRLSKWLNPTYFLFDADADSHDSLLRRGSETPDNGEEAEVTTSTHSSPRTSIISMYSLEKNARRTWTPSSTSSSVSSFSFPRPPPAATAAERCHSVVIRPFSRFESPETAMPLPRHVHGRGRVASAPESTSPPMVDAECFASAMMGVDPLDFDATDSEEADLPTTQENVAPLQIAKNRSSLTIP